jgi:phage repressor protein C with HTH and peptisase S24 domain
MMNIYDEGSSMSNAEEVAERILARMNLLGFSQADIMRATEASKGTVSKWLSGMNVPSGKFVTNLAIKLQTTSEWLLTGEGLANQTSGRPMIVTKEEYSHEFIWIDVVDIRFSCGEGISIEYHYDEIKESLPFMPEFFVKKGVRPENTKIMVAAGDSMEDYIYDQDLFAVDFSSTEIRDGNIYAVYFEGEAMLKQIFKEEGGVLVLHSKNAKYPDKRVTEKNSSGFKVIGRQFWRSG